MLGLRVNFSNRRIDLVDHKLDVLGIWINRNASKPWIGKHCLILNPDSFELVPKYGLSPLFRISYALDFRVDLLFLPARINNWPFLVQIVAPWGIIQVRRLLLIGLYFNTRYCRTLADVSVSACVSTSTQIFLFDLL